MLLRERVVYDRGGSLGIIPRGAYVNPLIAAIRLPHAHMFLENYQHKSRHRLSGDEQQTNRGG